MKNLSWILSFVAVCPLMSSGMIPATPAARIVSPPAGNILFWGDFVEVELYNLRLQDVDLLRVEAGAFLQQDEWQGFPLFECEGSTLSRVTEVGGGGCVFLTWVNKEAGLAKVRVPWNFIPAGFSEGTYFIRVKFYIVHGDFVTYWAVTDWHLLNLQKRPEPLAVEIVHPASGASYVEGESMEIKGRVYAGVLPLEITVEASAKGKEWIKVKTQASKTLEFTISLNTSEIVRWFDGYLGEYVLRTHVIDGQGREVFSNPIKVFVKPVGPTVKILLDRPGPFFVGDDVKFSFVTEPADAEKRWIAVKWSFGDGAESTEWAPVHRYAKTGLYEVKLEVQDATGFIAKTTTKIEVKEKIVLVATRKIWGYPVCGGSRVTIGLLREKEVTVEIRLSLLEEVSGLLIRETLPPGVQGQGNLKTADPRVEWQPIKENGSQLEWLVWGLDGPISKGTELIVEYTALVEERAILGEGIFEGEVFVMLKPVQSVKVLIVGDSEVRIVSAIPTYIALYFLTKQSNGGFVVRAPSANESFLLTAEHMQIVRHFLENKLVIPNTENRLLTAKDYLELQALYINRVPLTTWLELYECEQR